MFREAFLVASGQVETTRERTVRCSSSTLRRKTRSIFFPGDEGFTVVGVRGPLRKEQGVENQIHNTVECWLIALLKRSKMIKVVLEDVLYNMDEPPLEIVGGGAKPLCCWSIVLEFKNGTYLDTEEDFCRI